MRYTLKIIFFFFILTYLVSCGNTSKKNDEPTQKSQHEDARKLKYSDGIAGEVIAQNAAKKLGAKLNLTTEQTGRLSDLLQQTLTGSGYDLEKSYSLEESKDITRTIRANAVDSMSAILDSAQMSSYMRFISKQEHMNAAEN